MHNTTTAITTSAPGPLALKGYDPELLYVECGRCGSPVMWEQGRASRILEQAGIDPLELDASCLLVTDGCPMCGSKGQYRFSGSAPDRKRAVPHITARPRVVSL